MTNKHKVIKITFEIWIKKQYGKHTFKFEFSKDGYKDKTLNAMWVGFAAGVIITEAMR